MVIKDQVSNETAARAYSQQGHGNQQADPKAGYISATSRRRAIELLRTAAGTYIMGSDPALAAQTTSGRFGKLRSRGSRSLPQQFIHSRAEFLHIDYYANSDV